MKKGNESEDGFQNKFVFLQSLNIGLNKMTNFIGVLGSLYLQFKINIFNYIKCVYATTRVMWEISVCKKSKSRVSNLITLMSCIIGFKKSIFSGNQSHR